MTTLASVGRNGDFAGKARRVSSVGRIGFLFLYFSEKSLLLATCEGQGDSDFRELSPTTSTSILMAYFEPVLRSALQNAEKCLTKLQRRTNL